MKPFIKRLALGLGGIVAACGAWAAYVGISGIPRYDPPAIPDLHVAITPERVARGQKLSNMLCSECHEDHTTGKLTGRRMADMPPEFGVIVSRNITRHPDKGIGRWTDGELAVLLRTGLRRDGQYVPPYMVKLPHISDEDLASLIAYLRSDDPKVAPSDADPPGVTQPSFLTKALTHTLMKPLPYPSSPIGAPPKGDPVALGRYLTVALDCFACHSADFKSMNVMEPEKTPGYMGGGNTVTDVRGGSIRTANLTPDDETGIGKWTEADFVRALKSGFRPDGRVLRYPMMPRTSLDDEEAAAIYAYLRTIPKIRNPVPRAFDVPVPDGDPGRKLYVGYGCVACHGDDGAGRGNAANLRRANEHFTTDAELRAWIDEAPSKKPGTGMPGWKGIIREEDYPALIGYVRKLARDDRSAWNR